jgi:hypothetical protein
MKYENNINGNEKYDNEKKMIMSNENSYWWKMTTEKYWRIILIMA